MYLENNLASKIQQSQHYTSERDVEGAVPYMVCENINVVGDNTHC